jgi:cyclic-di-GMP phosphodiesterase TipF (flagellum assembly factor)
MSVEVIQDLIKKLADELNSTPPEGAPQTGDHRPAEPEARPKAAMREASPAPRPGTGVGQPPAPRPGTGVGQPPTPRPGTGVGQPPAPRPGTGVGQSPAGASPSSTLPAPLARIAEAVSAQRVEILLEPIHALVEGRPRHVEVSMRLVTADGAAVEQAELARAARGTPLMPGIDTLRVMHAMRVARRLGDRGRQGSVLALIEGQSLVDEAFLAAAVSEAGTAVSKRLVLSFAQAAVRAFSSGHTEVLKTLVRAGLRFALDEVADLDMDFAALKAMGFDFLKLDAQRFLDGLPAAGGHMPASDICRHLADFGLTLVVGRIEDEWLLARILGFGVLFGKGALFGAPRIVRDEAGATDAAAGVRP